MDAYSVKLKCEFGVYPKQTHSMDLVETRRHCMKQLVYLIPLAPSLSI